MDRRILIVIAVVAVIAVASAGTGYALYQGRTYSEDNTVDIKKNSVDIYVDNGSGFVPSDKPISMPKYVRNSTVDITGYRLVTSSPGDVMLIFMMPDDVNADAGWALIESMTLSFDVGDDYDFGVVGTNTGVPTAWIPLTAEGSTFEQDGETLVYHDFTITIEFADIDAEMDPDWEKLTSFADCRFEFVFRPASS